MIQNFRGKLTKDIETASETIISSMSFSNKILNGKDEIKSKPSASVTFQHLDSINFDNFIEKKK